MKKSFLLIPGLLMITALLLIISGCQKKQEEAGTMTLTKTPSLTFGKELQFLRQHTEVLVLSDSTGKAKLIAAPAWQGRVMTSSADGDKGLSFGWINHELIKSGEVQEHINVFGGEDRLWLGPEGGQFSIFFKNGDPFNLDHWYVPAMMDTEALRLSRRIRVELFSVKRPALQTTRALPLMSSSQEKLKSSRKRISPPS